MTHSTPPVALDALLAHRSWVRALARRLAADDATADDLEQEAWLEAVRRPPTDSRNLRGWFASVLRNRARKQHRSTSRRAMHERSVAPARASAATEDVVQEAEAQQRLVAAVLALEEPYRSTMLWRFYDRMPPRLVARKAGVPVETVRTRVKRAVECLRRELGGPEAEGAWLGAIAPLLAGSTRSRGAGGVAGSGEGAVLMSSKTILVSALAGVVVVGVTAGAVLVSDGGPSAVETAGPSATAPESAAVPEVAVRPETTRSPAAPSRDGPASNAGAPDADANEAPPRPEPVVAPEAAGRAAVEGGAPGGRPRGDPRRPQSDMDRKLAVRVSFDFDRATPTEILDYIATVARLNVVVDPGVDLTGIPVTLKLTDVTANAALNTLAIIVDCKLEVTGEVILLTR